MPVGQQELVAPQARVPPGQLAVLVRFGGSKLAVAGEGAGRRATGIVLAPPPPPQPARASETESRAKRSGRMLAPCHSGAGVRHTEIMRHRNAGHAAAAAVTSIAGVLRAYFGTFSQSARNFFSPASVSGCFASWSMTENGIVATSAPSFAASSTCTGWRTDATSTFVANR